jgi:NADH dehydrogenase (ubiquinone) 1 beta subcomplex subunit 1
MVSLLQIVRDHWVHILVPSGFVLGCFLDRKNDERLTAFRNKSLLYKRLVHASPFCCGYFGHRVLAFWLD